MGGSVIGDDDVHDFAIQVRPKPDLVRSGFLTLFIVPLPIFLTLVFLGLRNGSWPVAVYGEVVCALLCVLGLVVFRAIFIGITATAIIERGFFGRTTTAVLSDVASVVIVHTYRTSTAETLPQLIVRNRQGARLLRMRGQIWTEEAMHSVANCLDATLEQPQEAMTSQEFFTRYEGSAYWFENRPILAIVMVAIAIGLCVAIVLGLMRLLGQPIFGV